MNNLESAKSGLLGQLKNNPLQDADDVADYITIASRLAALGESCILNKFMDSEEPEEDTAVLSGILRERCEHGRFEIANYPGEDLALAIIEANDFYCFMRRFGDHFPRLKQLFRSWWEDCNKADIDEECAELLEAFVDVYPIPEEDRITVVNIPVTVVEHALLEFACQSGHPGMKWLDGFYQRELEYELEEDKRYAEYAANFPVPKKEEYTGRRESFAELNKVLTPNIPAKQSVITARWNTGEVCYQPSGTLDVPVQASPQIMILACDDNVPGNRTKKLVQASTGEIPTLKGTIKISRFLDDDWKLQIDVKDLSGNSVSVDRIQISNESARPDKRRKTRWYIDMKTFDSNKRNCLLNEPLIVLLSDGVTVQCVS